MTTALLAVLGAVGLFLIGMVVLERGLEGLAGGRLGTWLVRSTKSPASGAATGFALTTALQSSSATTLATVGLVGAGMLTFPQALGVVLGANVGSTTTGWLVALLGFEFDIGGTAGPLVFVGALLHLFSRGRARHAGLALAGFGVLLVGIDALQASLAGFEDDLTADDVPSGGFGARLALVAIGAAVTLVTQSSGAGVAATMAALGHGLVTLDQALALVIGMDIGTTGTAVLGALGGTTGMRRTAAAHVLFNLFTASFAVFLVTPYLAAVELVASGAAAASPQVVLVGFQTTFNLIGVAIAVPLARPFARFVTRLVPEHEPPLTRALDPRLASQPSVALDACAHVLQRVARTSLRALLRTLTRKERRDSPAIHHDELLRAVDRVVALLAAVPTGAREPHLFARETALVHQADHLRRLLHRLANAPDDVALVNGAAHSPEHDGLRRRITAALARTLRSTGGSGRTGFDPEPLARVHSELLEKDEELRRATLARAAAGEAQPLEALAALDRLRWQRRALLHAWRIASYSNEARPGRSAGEERSEFSTRPGSAADTPSTS
jgi:phosphate:Na+ symporter